MQIRVVNSRADITTLDPEERVVHLTIPISTADFFGLIQRCPRLEAIQVPPFKFRDVSKSSRRLLEVRGVKIFPGRIRSHRTDIDEHYTIDDGVILQRTEELRAAGLDSMEIVAKVAEEARVSPGLVGFILER